MRGTFISALTIGLSAIAACSSSESAPAAADDGGAPTSHDAADDPEPAPTLRADVVPVTGVEQAKPGVFIPPFTSCRAPIAGDTANDPSGKVCTHVAISGATEPGKYFPDYAACDVVRTQRPYGPRPAHGKTDAQDPRLGDATFMGELAWVTSQVRASACTCCHDARQAPMGTAQWNIAADGIWTDTASDAAIALFSGLADSTLFGHYDPADNHGFERTTTGLPSTDAPRMRAFFFAELARRNISQAAAAAVPAFGGPIRDVLDTKPSACNDGIGVAANGTIRWGGAPARYVYVLDVGAKNPLFPPDADLPTGTLWRLDVLASADAVPSGIRYGRTPPGSFQAFPASGRAPALAKGTAYHLYVLSDVGLLAQNCVFTFGG